MEWRHSSKKLIEAARHWALGRRRPPANRDELESEARSLGLSEADTERLLGTLPEPEPFFEVLAENWETLAVFLNLSTQWRLEVPPMSGGIVYHGLPHSEIESTLRLMAIRKAKVPKVFEGLKLMENEALEHLNAR